MQAVGHEVSLSECSLQAWGVDRASGDLEVNLYVDVDCACVVEGAGCAEQPRDKPADEHEFGPASVGANNPQEGGLRCPPCGL